MRWQPVYLACDESFRNWILIHIGFAASQTPVVYQEDTKYSSWEQNCLWKRFLGENTLHRDYCSAHKHSTKSPQIASCITAYPEFFQSFAMFIMFMKRIPTKVCEHPTHGIWVCIPIYMETVANEAIIIFRRPKMCFANYQALPKTDAKAKTDSGPTMLSSISNASDNQFDVINGRQKQQMTGLRFN